MLSVFRAVVRHARHINDASIDRDLRHIKHCISRKSLKSPRQLRNGITKLYEIEAGLRDIRNKRSSVARLREILGTSHTRSVEKNQMSTITLWMQRDERRFDMVNKPPPRGSSKFCAVDRMSKFSAAANEFKTLYGLNGRSVVSDTILAPFFKHRPKKQHTSPRVVEMRSTKRSAGSLYLLRVGGIRMRARGFRRHLIEVDRQFYDRFTNIQSQIDLAKDYSRHQGFDGEDMSEWIKILQTELRRQHQKLHEYTQKLEVQRRILARRMVQLQCYWDFKSRIKKQNMLREEKLRPPLMITLDEL